MIAVLITWAISIVFLNERKDVRQKYSVITIRKQELYCIDAKGVWYAYLEGNFYEWQRYLYVITTHQNEMLYKSDPFGFYSQERPSKDSKVYDIEGYDNGFFENDKNYIADSLEMVIGVIGKEFGIQKALDFTTRIIVESNKDLSICISLISLLVSTISINSI